MFVQVSGGKELMLKPGLNIIGGLQPRGPKDMPDMLDMDIVLAVEVGPAGGCGVVPGGMAIELDMVGPFDAIMSISKLSVIALLCMVGIAMAIESIETEAIGISLSLDVSLAAGPWIPRPFPA